MWATPGNRHPPPGEASARNGQWQPSHPVLLGQSPADKSTNFRRAPTLWLAVSRANFGFSVGNFRVWVVSDGTYTYPSPATTLFIDAPPDRLRARLAERGIDLDGWSQFVSDYSCLLVDTGRERVLIDTGGGRLSGSTGKLLANLEAIGVSSNSIGTIILTHAHSDHTGGNVDSAGRSAFPASRFKMTRTEWDYWTSAPDLSRLRIPIHIQRVLANVGHDYLEPIRSQVDLIAPNAEVVPGIELVDTAGHTPGHVAVDVSSRGEHLLFVSDAILHPLHIEEPGWNASVDVSPEDATESRRRLLRRAVAERALVHGFHFAFPGLGRVTPVGEGWSWKPLTSPEGI